MSGNGKPAGAPGRRAGAEDRECQPMRDLMEECAEYERIVDGLTEQRDRWQRVAGEHAAEIKRLRAEREERTGAERRVLDMWPRYADGELVWFGEYGRAHIESFEFTPDAVIVRTNRETRKLDHGARVQRPPLLASDGLPIEVGQTLYGESDGRAWAVTGFDRKRKYSVWAHDANDPERHKCLRPEWLVHDRPDSFERIAGNLRRCAYFGCSDEELCALADRIEKLAGRS